MDSLASGSRKADIDAPPPYEQNPNSPLLLAETRTTRTEIVTTTTTETTTHFLSLPPWRKPSRSQAPAEQPRDVDDTSPRQSSGSSLKSPSSSLFLDKALPPIPTPEPVDDDQSAFNAQYTPATATFTHSEMRPENKARSRKASAGTAALAHAALGLGLPHASIALPRPQVNVIPFTSASSSSSSPTVPSPNVRRVKSLHRLQKSQSFEGREALEESNDSLNPERRRRGLSFSTTSFLNMGNLDVKGKGKESPAVAVEAESPRAIRKSLSRKGSFWNRKKDSKPSEPQASNPSKEVQGDTYIILPPLPPVYQTSPFDMAEFSYMPRTSSDRTTARSDSLSAGPRSHNPALGSPRLTSAVSSPPWPNPPQKSANVPADPGPSKVNFSGVPKPRRQTSTPFLHRLSLGVFSLGDESPTLSASGSRSQILGSPVPRHSTQRQDSPVPRPLEGNAESPEIYLSRLRSAVTRAEVAGILASSPDPFYSRALRVYIDQFEFRDIPLDVALRKLLMEVGLPRETQQIDRVMEAFASRYMGCNSDIFTSEDHPYILAFSLIMLHTDAFNPSNKRKMSKADYIKNTKLPGIPTEILDCFFDNIVFAPFIFIEDPVDFNGQPGLLPDVKRPVSMAIDNHASIPSPSPSVSTPFKIGNRIDPYFLIINNMLEPLRVDVGSYVPLDNPFTYEGTSGAWNEQDLHEAFTNASIVEVEPSSDNRTMNSFSLNASGKSGTPTQSSSKEFLGLPRSSVEKLSLKVSKVGLLNRKDDVLEGGRKSANRKWKSWSVILTGSQLLFFRDPSWPSTFSPASASSEHLAPRTGSSFRPDESFSLKDSIAIYDRLYTKYKNTFRFILPDGRQMLLQAADEKDLNEWISRINYASTFKSTGVKMRPPGLSGEDALLTGVAAATSHLHDMQKRPDLPRRRSWDSNAPSVLMDMLSGSPPRPRLTRRVTVASSNTEFDSDVPIAPEVDGAEQFKATFDRVKAHLAAESVASPHNESHVSETDSDPSESPASSPRSFDSTDSRLPSRSRIIESKIRELDSKIAVSQSQLESDLRLVRNIAILTPFQKSTRARLATAVQNIGKRITQVRLELEKLKCHRVVLRRDLASEGRSWNRSQRVALRVARETLRNRSRPSTASGMPTMTFSALDSSQCAEDTSPSSHSSAAASPRPASSTSGSFHSAVDFGLGWPSSDEMVLLGSKGGSHGGFDSSLSSLTSVQSPSKGHESRERTLSLASSTQHHESNRADTEGEEIAEAWNQTRCAKRVSLIQVPSDIQMTLRVKGSKGP